MNWEQIMSDIDKIETIENGSFDVWITTGYTIISRNSDDLYVAENYYSESKIKGVYDCIEKFKEWCISENITF